MKLEKEEYELLSKKLEFRFKNSGNEVVTKIANQEELTNEDVKLLVKKLEFNFKKSGNALVEKLNKIAKA
jgi:hypothetical protein